MDRLHGRARHSADEGDSPYQDAYLEAGGAPANVMEVLAVTLAFEKRVAGSYARTPKVPGIARRQSARRSREYHERRRLAHPVGEPRRSERLEPVPTATTRSTAAIKRYADADREVYQRTLAEHEHVIGELMSFRAK